MIGSDGVWEFLTNAQVAKIALPFYEKGAAEMAANAIVKEAVKQWKAREEVIDDITAVVVFFDAKLIDKALRESKRTMD